MGTALMKYNTYKGKTYELIVTTYQMCILMLFNSNKSQNVPYQLSFEEIFNKTKM